MTVSGRGSKHEQFKRYKDTIIKVIITVIITMFYCCLCIQTHQGA